MPKTISHGAHRSLAALSLLLAALTFCANHASAQGEDADPPVCKEDCAGIVEAWMGAEQAAFAPIISQNSERFDAEDANCAVVHAEGPVVHAIVVAPFYDKFLHLPGTQNDARLWKSLLEERGIEPTDLKVLSGNAVRRDDLIAAMRAVVPCVKERDQIVFAFSGVASSYARWGFASGARFIDRHCAGAAGDALAVAAVCAPQMRPAAETVAEGLADNYSDQMLLTSETSIADRNPEGPQLAAGDVMAGVTSRELSNFAVQVQNRGADAIFVIDSSFAADFALLDQQQKIGAGKLWRWERDADVAETDPGIVELFGSGELAALYATRGNDNAFEATRTGDLLLGELTFAVAEALRTMQNPTIEQLSREIDRTMEEEESDQIPVFEATNAGLRFMSPRGEPNANADRIEMISPQATRGAVAIAAPELTVVARYAGSEPPAFASIDGLNVEIGANGQFRRQVKLDGRTEIAIRVFGKDASVLAERSLLIGADAVKASLAPVGRRIALIIGNRAYTDPAFPVLTTPIDDAKAVQTLLAEHFGFSTTLETGPGKKRDLLLVDATKMDILKALSDLRKNLTAEDQLVIFYAGHGVVDSEQTSYWVPVDASREDYSWIRAFDITEELRKISSGAVLLISDSCYAGGLSRDVVAAPPTEARDRYLAKSTRYKARQLIASGGNEPVADGGGKGHSLFAQALLDSLAEMPETVFTANELFDAKIKPKVVASAFATSAKGQTPVFYRITHAGDEPESEFVFVRK